MEPPWVKYPGVHPFSMHWRMGTGESYLSEFWPWWAQHSAGLDADGRQAYLRQWPTPPPAWTLRAVAMIWPELEDDIDLAEDEDPSARQRVFTKVAEAGLPGEAAWWADLNDPKWL